MGPQTLLDVMLNWVMRIDAKEVIVLTTTFDAKLIEAFERYVPADTVCGSECPGTGSAQNRSGNTMASTAMSVLPDTH